MNSPELDQRIQDATRCIVVPAFELGTVLVGKMLADASQGFLYAVECGSEARDVTMQQMIEQYHKTRSTRP